MTAIAGRYEGPYKSGGAALMNIALDGNPALSDNSCCLTTVCATGVPTTGIAVLDVNTGTTIYTAWVNSKKTSGFLWMGQKQQQLMI